MHHIIKTTMEILILLILNSSASSSASSKPTSEDQEKISFIRALQKPINDNLSCTTLRYSYFWIPTTSILEPCDDFERANKTKTFLKSNLQDALCLLYFESFYHLCAETNDMNKHEIQSYANYQQYKKIIHNKEPIGHVCKHFKNVTSITGINPAFSSLFEHLGKQPQCSLLCEEFDGSVAVLCKISAFMLGVVQDMKKDKVTKRRFKDSNNSYDTYRTFFYIYGTLLGVLLVLILSFVKYRKKIVSMAYGGQKNSGRRFKIDGQYEDLIGKNEDVLSL